MLGLKRGVLAGAVSLLAAGHVDAAALKLNIMIDGQPAEDAQVRLDGNLVGSRIPTEGLWLDNISGGDHRLELQVDGETIPVEFSLGESEAVFISVVSEAGQPRPVTSVQHVALDDVQVSGSGENREITVAAGVSNGIEPGTIEGLLTTADRGTPVRNATITVVGQDITTNSDRYGKFELELPQGDYQLRVEHPGHQSKLLGSVRVLPDMTLAVNVDLQPQASDSDTLVAPPVMEETLVTASYRSNNAIDIERISSSVVDSIDFAENARFDDSMLSSALKRVVGVSMEDDRYAIVRGMKSRYQSTYFDGVILPSTDPGRRDLPMDIFPSTIMQGLTLQKSATADVPGNATAGHIDMRTKSVPDEPFMKMSLSYGYGDAQEDEGYMVHGGGDDEWGMDDGFRDMPQEAANVRNVYFQANSTNYTLPPEQVEAVGESFNHYGAYRGDPGGDISASLSGGRSWDVGSQRFGLIGAFRYSSKWSNNEKTQYSFSKAADQVCDDNGNCSNAPGNEMIPALRDGTQTQDTDNIIDIGTMLNLAWDISDQHRLGLNNILLRHTTNSVEQATNYRNKLEFDPEAGGYRIPDGPPPTWNWDEKTVAQDIDWIEEQLLSHQLWGEHAISLPGTFLGDLQVDWRAMTATSEYDRPDAKHYTWSGTSFNQERSPTFRTGAASNYMLWEGMEEDTAGYRLDVSLPLAEGESVNTLVKAGGYILEREREGHRYQWYYNILSQEEVPKEVLESPDPAQILVPEYIVGTAGEDGFVPVAGGVAPENDVGLENGDHYRVDQTGDSWYLLADTDFWGRLRANIGVRQEKFEILADQFSYSAEPLFTLLDEDRTLPSLGLTYYFSDAWQLRAAYSETVSWPEVFEILPRTFRDIETLTTYIGNPNLKPADIENYDLRLEWYPSDTESVTLGYFHKDVTNGIENTFDRLGDDYSYYTFENVASATVQGWEVDVRQEFSFGEDFGHGLFVQANYTDITSEVNLPANTREYDPNRPLQGQPDYIVNLMMGYDHLDTGQELTLVFNRKGEELVVVTPPASNGLSNVYSEPYDDLKLIYRKSFFNGFAVAVSGENLLDAEKSEVYEREGVPYLTYKPGVRFKISADYEF